MKTISRYIMTLALLLTAVTGAWAADTYTVAGSNSDMFGAAWDAYAAANDMTKNDDGTYSITYTDVPLNDDVQYKVVENRDWGKAYPASNRVITIAEPGFYTVTIHFNPTTHEVYETMPGSEPAGVEVTTNAASKQDLFTEASFTMPPFDATVNYMLVRDMQDEANPVAFSGLPTNDEPIIVKKGDDGKYQPAEALTIQLIDPLAAAEAQNIIQADGITIKVLVGAENGQGAIDFDQDTPITLEAFLADMKPGYYWIKAEPTDENSPYDGTVYSSQFTVVEKYDLTVKPANDFSKGKVESVTVGSGSVTIDANTGEATKTGIAPETEVKIKAKRGYVIDKVEAKKKVPAEGHALTSAKFGEIVGSDGKAYAAADKDNLPSGVTAVAMICYVSGSHGLALALTDEGKMNWSTAQTTCAAHTPAITGGTWKLASKDEWNSMISAAGSDADLRDGFGFVGGTNMQSGIYWSSTEYEDNSSQAYYYDFYGGYYNVFSKGNNARVRACLAF